MNKRTQPPTSSASPSSVSAADAGAPIDVTPITIEATDGTKLVGTLYAAPAPRAMLLLNSGTAIPRAFYRRFAAHAAKRGYAVVTYDYRGVGGSAPDTLKGYHVNYRDWGQRDVPGAIDWCRRQSPELPLAVLGHSTGGQQLGLAHNHTEVDAAAFVAVSTGFWRGMPTRQKWFTWMLWKVYFPLSRLVVGYAAARPLGLGENLPAGVVREWGAWCLEHDYLAAYFDDTGRRKCLDGEPFGPQYFDDVRFPIRAYYLTDDDIATRANIRPMLDLYSGTDVETIWTAPSDIGAEAIGHLGFFRKAGTPLWDAPLDWLDATLQISG